MCTDGVRLCVHRTVSAPPWEVGPVSVQGVRSSALPEQQQNGRGPGVRGVWRGVLGVVPGPDPALGPFSPQRRMDLTFEEVEAEGA